MAEVIEVEPAAKKVKDVMGQRMKVYEQAMESRLDPNLPFMIRMDGHGFSKFTKGFRKPYDVRIHLAMVRTTADLVKQFQAVTGFTMSDEITLVFPPVVSESESEAGSSEKKVNPQTLIYDGRVQKIATLASGYCSARFNFHLLQEVTSGEAHADETPKQREKVLDRVTKQMAYFDARIFSLPKLEEVLNNLLWRSRYDCQRNSVAMLAQSHFNHKQLFGKKTQELKEMLLLPENGGISWDAQPNWFKHGTLIKKELIEKTGVSKKGEPLTFVRTQLRVKSFPLLHFEPRLVDMVMCKYWNDVEADVYQLTDDDLVIENEKVHD